jgi:hypothetical protein
MNSPTTEADGEAPQQYVDKLKIRYQNFRKSS